VTKQVLISADDFGLSVEVNEAIEQAHRQGVLSTANLMIAGDAAEDAIQRAKRLPLLKVGLHLVVIEGPSALPHSEIPLLVNQNNLFPSEQLRMGIDYFFKKPIQHQLRKEIRAQLQAFTSVDGISWRDANGQIVHNKDRAIIEDMDSLPFVTEVYKRDLRIEDYFIGYLKHPYLSLYTGRGCKSHCTFCLWPQTVGGHKYRTRSPEHVAAEIRLAQQYFPQVQEYFFDDDTFTDDLPRAEAIARELGKLGVTWSCNAKANVPRSTLKVLRDNGLRLLLVGYESGNQQILHNIKKGMRVEVAREFTKNCHELGIKIHGTFILGLPGETKETIQETIKFATEINPHTLQVSLAAPYPGTFLYKQAMENGWLDKDHAELIDEHGVQIAPLHYPHLSHTEIFDSVETFYKKFYFRAPKIASIVGEMITSPQMMKRRLREGVEFFQFLRDRHT